MNNEKYELVEDSKIEFEGRELFRIKALRDIQLFDGPLIKEGDLGGYIQNESNLRSFGNCWVGKDAKVYGGARVEQEAVVWHSAIVNDFSVIYNNAKIQHNAVVSNSRVSDYACIRGDANVSFARVGSMAYISGDAIIMGNGFVNNSMAVSSWINLVGDSHISKGTWTYAPLLIQGTRDEIQEDEGGVLAIGCIEKHIDWWLDHYERVGKENDYTDQQIKEYKLYIDLFASLLENRKIQ